MGESLINAIISNVPLYYMFIVKMPTKVIQILEKCQRDFLWEMGNGKNDHLVKWVDVCRPKNQGGLGMGRLKEKYMVLLAK